MATVFFFVALNLLILSGVYALFTSKESRSALWAEVRHSPVKSLFALFWVTGVLFFGWGALSLGHFSFVIVTPLGSIQSWQLGALVMLAGLVVATFVHFE